MTCTIAMNCAESSMKNPAIATRLTARASALWMGFRCVMTTIAETTARAESTKNARVSTGAPLPADHAVGNEHGGGDHVRERDLEERLPAEVHEVIVTEPGKGPAHPHEHELEECDLG